MSVMVVGGPPNIESKIAALAPTQMLQGLGERRITLLKQRIVRGCGHQHADAPYPLVLLGACGEWPGGRRCAEIPDEVAPSHARPWCAGAHRSTRSGRKPSLAFAPFQSPAPGRYDAAKSRKQFGRNVWVSGS